VHFNIYASGNIIDPATKAGSYWVLKDSVTLELYFNFNNRDSKVIILPKGQRLSAQAIAG
jgi:N-acetylmuramoyl-L-alanine amidase